jgi:hypothetical protein
VSSALDAAPERGRQKAMLVGSIAGVVLVVLVLLLLVARRRRRAGVPAGPDRYATLPASAGPGAEPGAEPGTEPGIVAGIVPGTDLRAGAGNDPGTASGSPPIEEEGAESS